MQVLNSEDEGSSTLKPQKSKLQDFLGTVKARVTGISEKIFKSKTEKSPQIQTSERFKVVEKEPITFK